MELPSIHSVSGIIELAKAIYAEHNSDNEIVDVFVAAANIAAKKKVILKVKDSEGIINPTPVCLTFDSRSEMVTISLIYPESGGDDFVVAGRSYSSVAYLDRAYHSPSGRIDKMPWEVATTRLCKIAEKLYLEKTGNRVRQMRSKEGDFGVVDVIYKFDCQGKVQSSNDYVYFNHSDGLVTLVACDSGIKSYHTENISDY